MITKNMMTNHQHYKFWQRNTEPKQKTKKSFTQIIGRITV